jgi:hypothetical protein
LTWKKQLNHEEHEDHEDHEERQARRGFLSLHLAGELHSQDKILFLFVIFVVNRFDVPAHDVSSSHQRQYFSFAA